MQQFGIDVSRYQGNFDFAGAVREGVRFVIVKGGGADDGYYKDRSFQRNYQQAKSVGIPVGVYWFSHALSEKDAQKEAAYFYRNIVQGKQFELPVFIDVEHDRMLALNKKVLTQIVKTWCNAMEAYGCWVGIYSSASVFRSSLEDDDLQAYTHWVAAWTRQCPYDRSCLGFWQFGGETNLLRSNRVAGVICDQDYMYRDFPALIKAAGRNGFSGNEAVTQEKPQTEDTDKNNVTQVAEEVIRGLWDNGAKRKKLLAAAGYDPAAVQKEVNRLLAERKKSPQEIAKEVIAGKWGNGAIRKIRLKKAGYDPTEIQALVNRMLT